MWQAMAAGAALGLGQGILDQQREKRDREEAAAIARYSPWTGMAPQKVQRSNMLGSVTQGAGQGAAMGQNIQTANAYNAMAANQGAAAAAPAPAPAAAPSPDSGGMMMQEPPMQQQNYVMQNQRPHQGGVSPYMSRFIYGQ